MRKKIEKMNFYNLCHGINPMRKKGTFSHLDPVQIEIFFFYGKALYPGIYGMAFYAGWINRGASVYYFERVIQFIRFSFKA
jgi:hypothetical protein